MTGLAYPDPEITPENEPFFREASEGKLLIKFCTTCERAFHYPRASCPVCHAEETKWLEATGNARVYSFTILRRAQVPYCIASVELEEGPRMLTNIVDTPFNLIRCEMPVRVDFRKYGSGISLPVFRIRGDDE